jgi:hypothetical protein
MEVGDTVRLMCPLTGAFCGLVRIVRIPPVECGPYTVFAETPILDWLSTGDRGEYPHRMHYEIGHRFNAEAEELSPTLDAARVPPADGEEET